MATYRYADLNPKARALVDAAIARDARAKPQRDRRDAPRETREPVRSVVVIAGPLHVRITRRVPHSGRLDDDNLSGGAKQLRDAIAAFLGRKGDSEKDGLTWEYRQEKWTGHETMIEVFNGNEN